MVNHETLAEECHDKTCYCAQPASIGKKNSRFVD